MQLTLSCYHGHRPIYLLRMRSHPCALNFTMQLSGWIKHGLSVRLSGIFSYPACLWNQGVRIIILLRFYCTLINSHPCTLQQASFLNLTTSDHVWILPSYYNPDWWKGGGADYLSNQQTRNCTDEDMMDILNSVIFIDPVKYPPMVRKCTLYKCTYYNYAWLFIMYFRVLRCRNFSQHC